MLPLNRRRPLIAAFCTVELILGILLHTLDGAIVARLSFLSVVLAFLFCFSFFEKSPVYLFTQIALLFTVAADSILVFQHMEYATLAMCFFSVTQLAYAARLHLVLRRDLRPWHIAVRILLSAAGVGAVFLVVGKAADALAVISIFYFANLILNAAFAAVLATQNPQFAIGLFLFVLCDIFVGFSMLGGYLPLPDTPLISFLVSPPINMAWVFYLPSQVLLALSTLPYKKGA